MKVYELYSSWYEEYVSYLFTHSKDKSLVAWKRDCCRAIREVGKDYIRRTSLWVGTGEWIRVAALKLEKYGYKPILPVQYGVFGSSVIFENDDSTQLKRIVGKEMYNKVIEKNEIFRKELDNGRDQYSTNRRVQVRQD